jgi:hypothetical protein
VVDEVERGVPGFHKLFERWQCHVMVPVLSAQPIAGRALRKHHLGPLMAPSVTRHRSPIQWAPLACGMFFCPWNFDRSFSVAQELSSWNLCVVWT